MPDVAIPPLLANVVKPSGEIDWPKAEDALKAIKQDRVSKAELATVISIKKEADLEQFGTGLRGLVVLTQANEFAAHGKPAVAERLLDDYVAEVTRSLAYKQVTTFLHDEVQKAYAEQKPIARFKAFLRQVTDSLSP